MRRYVWPMLLLSAFGATAQPTYVISTFAGGPDPPEDGAAATQVVTIGPMTVAVDSERNFYFSSGVFLDRILKVSPNGILTRIAGDGYPGLGRDGIRAVDSRVFGVTSVIADDSGNIYFSEYQRVRKISSDGILTTVAGSTTPGFVGDGGPSSNAQLNSPRGLAIDSSGNLYIADTNNARIRRVTPSGIITTYAGTGTAGFSGDNGPAASAQISNVMDIATDRAGNLFLLDFRNARIRKISLDGVIVTYAGTGSVSPDDREGVPAVSVSIGIGRGLTIDAVGNVYFGSSWRVRSISTDGLIHNLAGDGTYGYSEDGTPAVLAQFASPVAIAVDKDGGVYVADTENNRIRRISEGIVSTVAGASTFAGDGGPATEARLYRPGSLSFDAAGNLLVADTSNSQIRKIDSAGKISTLAGRGIRGFQGDGGLASQARLTYPGSAIQDNAGNYIIADYGNARIRKVTSDGVISTIAGGGRYSPTDDGDGRAATSATMNPLHAVFDLEGNLIFADESHHKIRKIGAIDGIITTIAGTGKGGFSGDGGPAAAAQLNLPSGVAIGLDGSVYIADRANGRIRKVSPDGNISTVAGNGSKALSLPVDGSLATEAVLFAPNSVALDRAGNVYFAELSQIHMILPDGTLRTIAGGGNTAFSGDSGPARNAGMNPNGLAIDSSGNIYLSDQSANRIRKLTPMPQTAQ